MTYLMTIKNQFIRKVCNFAYRNVFSNTKMSSRLQSELAYIDIGENTSPFDLFSQWLDESKKFGKFNTVFFNLATSSSSGVASNRTLALRKFNQHGFTFTTNGNSKKIQQIKENPRVSACFFWAYAKEGKFINRQIRLEGIAEKLSKEECEELYNMEPTYAKIRSHICQQGEKVEWEELKKRHDELLEEVKRENNLLEMPEYQVAYRIIPVRFDFYYAWNNAIADRLVFTKEIENGWSHQRVCA